MSPERTVVPKTGTDTDRSPKGRFLKGIDEEKLKQGPIAVIECFQKIPCNPCETSCPNKAITVGANISNTPEIDHKKCTGCAICLRNCPGLAIFIVNGKESTVTLPYEFYPLPEKGTMVFGLNRNGEAVCEVEVKNTVTFPDCKNLITIKVPEKELMNIRHIKLK